MSLIHSISGVPLATVSPPPSPPSIQSPKYPNPIIKWRTLFSSRALSLIFVEYRLLWWTLFLLFTVVTSRSGRDYGNWEDRQRKKSIGLPRTMGKLGERENVALIWGQRHLRSNHSNVRVYWYIGRLKRTSATKREGEALCLVRIR